MSEQGAAIQHQFQELVSTVESLKKKRFNLQKTIELEEQKKQRIEKEIEEAQQRVNEADAKLENLMATKADIDATITQVETAFSKIHENTQLLLTMTRKAGGRLEKIM